jgi:hypothetical protein
LGRAPALLDRVWRVLNGLTPAALIEEGRVYGGGLHKLEPKELGNVPVPELRELLQGNRPADRQADLFEEAAA